MAFTFKPSLYNGTTLYPLPQTIQAFVVPWKWVNSKHAIPYKAGNVLYPSHEEGPVVTVAGVFAKQDGSDLYTESQMWGEVAALHDYLNSEDRFELFVYHDAGSTTYRKFKNVLKQDFTAEMGEQQFNLFTYSLILQLEDPTIYTTAPGA